MSGSPGDRAWGALLLLALTRPSGVGVQEDWDAGGHGGAGSVALSASGVLGMVTQKEVRSIGTANATCSDSGVAPEP